MVGWFRKGNAEGCGGAAGDAEFFDVGEEVGDDVVGVGGVEKAGCREVGRQEVKQGGEGLGKSSKPPAKHPPESMRHYAAR